MTEAGEPPGASLRPASDGAGRHELVLTGAWRLGAALPDPAGLLQGLDPRSGTLAFDTRSLKGWDSGLLLFLRRLRREAGRSGLGLDESGLPEGVRRLLALAGTDAGALPTATATRPPALARLGGATLRTAEAAADAVRFLGEVALAVAAVVRGRARFRGVDLAREIEQTGVRALPVVGLIAALVGMILAFIGAIQLVQFGAEIYVANLVAIGMLREMGAMMAAVIMAGRTGAAFAAELGTMQVNEEVDALVTTGLEPTAFLVLPRLVALLLMLPLLTVYAEILGIIGGAMVGTGILGVRPALYLDQTLRFIGPTDLAVGLIKAVVFAFVITLAGCYHGTRCGRSSAAVGVATTAAVVTGIVGIVVMDALLTLLFHAVGL